MRILELWYDLRGIARSVILSESGNEYDTCLDSKNHRGWCSCAFSTFNKERFCRHVLFLIDKIDYEEMKDMSNKLDRVSTGSQILDDLLGGGVPYGIVSGVYGRPAIGKSMYGYQIGLSSLKESNKKTLYIDTEGTRENDLRSLLYRFGKRFGLEKSDINKRFDIATTLGDIHLKSIQKLFQMFGQSLKLEQSRGGKYTAKFEFTTPIYKDDKLEEYSMIIIDSMSKPLKDSVGTNTSNLPTRSQIQERIFGMLTHIAVKYNIAVIIIHHCTHNPVNLFGVDWGVPTGGDSIIYNTKYVLEFWEATSPIKKSTGWDLEARRVRIFRHPTEQVDWKWIPIRLKKDTGYTDE